MTEQKLEAAVVAQQCQCGRIYQQPGQRISWTNGRCAECTKEADVHQDMTQSLGKLSRIAHRLIIISNWRVELTDEHLMELERATLEVNKLIYGQRWLKKNHIEIT